MKTTPRTDKVAPDSRPGSYERLLAHARKLERELAEANDDLRKALLPDAGDDPHYQADVIGARIRAFLKTSTDAPRLLREHAEVVPTAELEKLENDHAEELNSKQGKIDDLEVTVGDMEDEITDLKEEVKSLKEEVAKLEKELEAE